MVIFGFCAAARPWKPISWSSRRTVLVLMLFPQAVWNSVVSVATEDRLFLRTTHFSIRRSRSVSLCGLPLRGWAVVAPRHIHFTITALTVYWCHSSRAQIWQTDLLERWHPMPVPRWKTLSSLGRPFYCHCLSMEITRLCAQFYTPVRNGCGWNSWIQSFEWVFTYFCICSVFLMGKHITLYQGFPNPLPGELQYSPIHFALPLI